MKHWLSTQSSVTLSSGEAEFHGLGKGAAVSLGQQALYQDLGLKLPIRLWTDTSAAIGITSRQGLGKLRHVDTKTLWVQQAARTGRVEVRKVAGLTNPADLFTKHALARERISELVRLIGAKFVEGRPEAAPVLRDGHGKHKTMAEADKKMLLLRKEVSVCTSHVLEKLCASHRKWLQNQKSLLKKIIWSNLSSILRFHQNLKSSTNFVKKSLFRVCGLMTKTLAPLELSLYESYGVLLSRVLWLDN